MLVAKHIGAGSRARAARQARHITLPPRDQVHMTVHHALASDLPAVHPDVEPLDGLVLGQDVEVDLVEEEVDRPPLRFVQVEGRGSVASGKDKRVERRHWMTTTDGEVEAILDHL
jgi:hypothetical protein